MPQRDEKGRFVKGHNAPGPGRPPRATEADYLAAMTEIVTLDSWRAIVKRALADALQGDSRARAWLSGYLIGKPPQILDIRAADAALIARLMDALKDANMEPAEVFERMIQRAEEAAKTNGRE